MQKYLVRELSFLFLSFTKLVFWEKCGFYLLLFYFIIIIQVDFIKHWNWHHCKQKTCLEKYVRLKRVRKIELMLSELSLLNMPEYVWICLNKQDSEFIFFICYLAAQRPTLSHCQGGSLTKLMFRDQIN